jgi:hypothetical protein
MGSANAFSDRTEHRYFLGNSSPDRSRLAENTDQRPNGPGGFDRGDGVVPSTGPESRTVWALFVQFSGIAMYGQIQSATGARRGAHLALIVAQDWPIIAASFFHALSSGTWRGPSIVRKFLTSLSGV